MMLLIARHGVQLRRTIAVPYRHRGAEQLADSEFIATVAMELEWFTPDQARRLVTVATSEGLLERDDGTLRPTFDPTTVETPPEFTPDETVLTRRSTFERLLDRITETGIEKQAAVAEINRLQDQLAVSIEAAAVVYARRNGIEVDALAEQAADELRTA